MTACLNLRCFAVFLANLDRIYGSIVSASNSSSGRYSAFRLYGTAQNPDRSANAIHTCSDSRTPKTYRRTPKPVISTNRMDIAALNLNRTCLIAYYCIFIIWHRRPSADSCRTISASGRGQTSVAFFCNDQGCFFLNPNSSAAVCTL